MEWTRWPMGTKARSKVPERRKLGVRRHQQKLSTHKASLRPVLKVVQHRLAGLCHRTPEPVHIQGPYGVGRAAAPTLQVTGLEEIAHANPRGELCSRRPTGRPGTTEEGLCATDFTLIASEGRLPVSRVISPFKADTTAGSRRTHSVDRSPEGSRISWAYWCSKRRSARVRLNRSTMPWSRWTSTRPRLTLTPCFARS